MCLNTSRKLLFYFTACSCTEEEDRLLEKLLTGHNANVRPVENYNDVITVGIGMSLNQIIKLVLLPFKHCFIGGNVHWFSKLIWRKTLKACFQQFRLCKLRTLACFVFFCFFLLDSGRTAFRGINNMTQKSIRLISLILLCVIFVILLRWVYIWTLKTI